MARSVVKKVVWVGRATGLLVGVAVMVGLFFAMAGAAFGANGDNFILGVLTNKADSVTRLVGNVAGGPALQINNNSAAAGSRALQIGVAEGQAPLTVNAKAGKATNLDADKVDGKEAADFLGKNETAADSQKLDGKGSGQFMTASTYYSTSPETTGQDIGNGTGIHHAEWGCDEGDQLLTGGYRWMVNATSVAVVGSWPSNNRWLVQWANTAHPNQPYPMQIYVKCADTAAPAHN